MGPCLTVLLVDDNKADRALFSLVVEQTNFDIRLETLTAGKEAIDYLEAKGVYGDRSLHPWPDVVVLDLNMPGMNGFDFLSWRKASRIYASIPVVVLSDSKNPGDMEMAARIGANKYFVKPSEFEDWQEVVREIWDIGTQGTSFFKQSSQGPPLADRSPQKCLGH